MRMKKTTKKWITMITITILSVCVVLLIATAIVEIFPFFSEMAFSAVTSIAETIALPASLILAIFQLRESKEIARSEFLVDLNKSFTESEGNIKLYTALQNCNDGMCSDNSKPPNHICTTDEEVCLLNIDKIVISNYLTFFETIYLLLCEGVITFDMIDDLFAYRFFLAVHSKFVQQQKLETQPENFRNIYLLEREWMEYRLKRGKPMAENSVYNKNQLEHVLERKNKLYLYKQWGVSLKNETKQKRFFNKRRH